MTVTQSESSVQVRRRSRWRLTFSRAEFLFSLALILPSALLIGVFVVLPFLNVLIMGFEDIQVGSIHGRFVGLDNYAWAVNSPELRDAALKSLVWTVGTVGLQIVLGVGYALLLNRNIRARGWLRALTLFPYMVPTIVAVLVWRYLMHDLVGPLNHLLMQVGLIDKPLLWLSSPRWAMLSVIIIAAWKHFPFVVIVMLAMLQTIPREQYEAADIDGANEGQQFLYITLPALLPAIGIVALIRIIFEMNGFDVIFLLTGGGPINSTRTLPILVYTKAFSDFQLGRAAAAASITFLIMVAVLAAGQAVRLVTALADRRRIARGGNDAE